MATLVDFNAHDSGDNKFKQIYMFSNWTINVLCLIKCFYYSSIGDFSVATQKKRAFWTLLTTPSKNCSTQYYHNHNLILFWPLSVILKQQKYYLMAPQLYFLPHCFNFIGIIELLKRSFSFNILDGVASEVLLLTFSV